MAPNNMNSPDQMEDSNIRGQSQNDQPPIDIELEDEMADSMHFTLLNQCLSFILHTVRFL